MTTAAPTIAPTKKPSQIVEMNWDPITRIVGSLGHLHQDRFQQPRGRRVPRTSSIFRGYSIFMKGKDPRDAHFITSRICGICGDNHATCSVYAQNMAYRHQAAGHRRMDHQSRRSRRVHVRPQHLSGQSRRRRLLREDGQGDQSRCVGQGAADTCAARRRSRLQARSPTSWWRSIPSPANSTARRCRSAATRARCSA